MTFRWLGKLGLALGIALGMTACSGSDGGPKKHDTNPIGDDDAGSDAGGGSHDVPDGGGHGSSPDAGHRVDGGAHDAGSGGEHDAGATHDDAGSAGDGDGGDGDTTDAGTLPMDGGGEETDAGHVEPDAGHPPPPPDLRLNHLQVTGTHNSYHKQTAVPVDASHKYTHKPLNEQLEGGVRTLELDLHRNLSGGISVYHIAVIDEQTTCSSLSDCLNVIKGWSDAHPKHTPIFVWFEIKNDTTTPGVNNIKGALKADEIDGKVREVFGEQQIITPASIQGSYANPKARVDAEGWPKLADVAGKVMFVLLNTDDLSKDYTHGYADLNGRTMFASADSNNWGKGWALVTKIGPTDGNAASGALANNMLVCTNVCSVDTADDVCEGNLSAAVGNGIHMLQDDLPFPISGRSYYLHVPSPNCNPKTAPAGCTTSLLEQ